jgi:hypothetical protein
VDAFARLAQQALAVTAPETVQPRLLSRFEPQTAPYRPGADTVEDSASGGPWTPRLPSLAPGWDPTDPRSADAPATDPASGTSLFPPPSARSSVGDDSRVAVELPPWSHLFPSGALNSGADGDGRVAAGPPVGRPAAPGGATPVARVGRAALRPAPTDAGPLSPTDLVADGEWTPPPEDSRGDATGVARSAHASAAPARPGPAPGPRLQPRWTEPRWPGPGGPSEVSPRPRSGVDTPPAPIIRVTIGRIDVRAVSAPPAGATRPAPAGGADHPRPSLAEYLRRRTGGAGP